ncbi:hypothetical protein [Massilia sp. TN1-12]|uniref:hypothetical protein n=1 Tax=Massilia paldalensis TaxID=3377675 RepID=UPI00384C5CC6
MNVPAFASAMVMMALAGPAAADETPSPAQPSLRARLSGDVIKEAVRETLAEAPATRKEAGPVLRADRYEAFGREMEEARVPSCWHADAMKHQPPKIGPINIGGIFVLPFLAAAIVRGKCSP